jgi:hypothetical protein
MYTYEKPLTSKDEIDGRAKCAFLFNFFSYAAFSLADQSISIILTIIFAHNDCSILLAYLYVKKRRDRKKKHSKSKFHITLFKLTNSNSLNQNVRTW